MIFAKLTRLNDKWPVEWVLIPRNAVSFVRRHDANTLVVGVKGGGILDIEGTLDSWIEKWSNVNGGYDEYKRQ